MSEDSMTSKSVIKRVAAQRKATGQSFEELKENCLSEEEMKPLLDRVEELCKEAEAFNQEDIFKFLWPDKCCEHDIVETGEYYGPKDVYGENNEYVRTDDEYLCECNVCGAKGAFDEIEHIYPDLTDPAGMVMIVKRLDEMGYTCVLNGFSGFCEVYNEEAELLVEGLGDTFQESTLDAVESLIRKEEEGE